MGGIPEEQVEWALVNRLKAMLDEPPKTVFNVTQTFALFSAILLWTKNRAWTPAAEAKGPVDQAAIGVRTSLRDQAIQDAPWRLSRRLPAWGDGPVERLGGQGEVINQDFENMRAERFFEWLRHALAHGDGRTVRPLHKPSDDYQREWLAGFVIEFNEGQRSKNKLRLTLTEADMKRLGACLADAFCVALADGHDYAARDLATRVVEVAA